MRLQLQKSYGGDSRFKLTEDFDVSLTDANRTKNHVSDVMLGGLSKREQQDFFNPDKNNDSKQDIAINTGGYDSLDEEGEATGTIHWKHNLNLEKERSQALNILSQIVPANEVFLTSSKAQNKGSASGGHQSNEIDKLTKKGDQSGTKKRAMHIKRFDPSNPHSFALLVKPQE